MTIGNQHIIAIIAAHTNANMGGTIVCAMSILIQTRQTAEIICGTIITSDHKNINSVRANPVRKVFPYLLKPSPSISKLASWFLCVQRKNFDEPYASGPDVKTPATPLAMDTASVTSTLVQ
ncbi:unknown [Corallococcus sp. CAG:1435]|nr:unknown [Corallococcus sp. CAG:1435]